jgi:hypothetical protein
MKQQSTKKPEVSSKFAQKELDKAEAKFEAFQEEVKSLTQDRMNEAPKEDFEKQTKLSQKEIDKSSKVWLKPERAHSPGPKEKFNEAFRKAYEHAKEYVQFIAEHREIIGETIEIWTKPFGGMDAEYWLVPTNKPVWGPRYLADQIKRCAYHRLSTQQSSITSADGMGQYFGTLVADKTIQRLDAYPVQDKKSVFLGASSF